MRGGSSKGLFLRAEDLPADQSLRDRLLLAAMGSPDARQIDGMGGGNDLASKIVIVAPSRRADADVEYQIPHFANHLIIWGDIPESSR